MCSYFHIQIRLFNEIQVLTVKENVLKSQTIVSRMAAEFTRILGELIVHYYYYYFLNKQSFLHNISKVFLPLYIPFKPGRIVLPMFSAIVTSQWIARKFCANSKRRAKRTARQSICDVMSHIIRMVTFGGGEHHGMFLSRGLKWYWGKIIRQSRGTYILPEISFQTPRYWEHSVMFPTTKSPSVILYGYPLSPHCLARLRHSSQKFTKLSIFFSGDFL